MIIPHQELFVIAHRGASGVVGSDNTQAAFSKAISLACDFIETDLHRCADGTIVCFHDAQINGRAVAEMSFIELQECSAEKILSFADFLELCAGKIGLDIEIKASGFEAQVLAELSAYAIDDKVWIKSFERDVLATLRQLHCTYPLGLLIGGCPAQTDLDTYLRACHAEAERLQIDFISPKKSLICDRFFHPDFFAQLPCLVWTCDEVAEMRQLLQFPIHGIITNYPDRLLALCGRTPSDSPE